MILFHKNIHPEFVAVLVSVIITSAFTAKYYLTGQEADISEQKKTIDLFGSIVVILGLWIFIISIL